MEQKMVTVIFDRRNLCAKRGFGYLEVRVNLGHKVRRYVTVGTATPNDWEVLASSPETKATIKQCEGILSVKNFMGEESNIENSNRHFSGEDKKPKEEKEPDNSKKNFITYMEMALEGEELRPGTRRHKVVVIEAVKKFGRLNTYGDLTPKNIMAFDRWLHDGTRADVTCCGYHKKLHKWVHQLVTLGELDRDPYDQVTIKRGKCKERQPLLEEELKALRQHKFQGKLERVRDPFMFAAYCLSLVRFINPSRNDFYLDVPALPSTNRSPNWFTGISRL